MRSSFDPGAIPAYSHNTEVEMREQRSEPSMTIQKIIDGLILCVMAIAALEVCTSQSNPEEKEGKTISWKAGLPADAKLPR
jgi:hypothetical protein